MLQIKKLRYKNFLSSPSVWTELDFQNYRTTLIVGPNGAGKAQPVSSLVLTNNGWKQIGNLEVGDHVVSFDGTISTVNGIFPQGKKECYKITFADGRSVECCVDHLWKVWGCFNSKWQWKVLPLSDIIYHSSGSKKFETNLYVPLFEGYKFEQNQNHLIDPYLLGVLLGDGSFCSSSITLTSADDEILSNVSSLLESTCKKTSTLVLSKIDDRYGYRINYSLDCKLSPFRNEIERLGLLNKHSNEKFIPKEYMVGSLEQRLNLIQGLMDTDGHAGKNGCVSFCTTSKELAFNIRELLWSIGAIVKIVEKQTFYNYKGEKRKGKLAYNLNIRYKEPHNLFRLSRKKERVKDYQYENSLRLKIISIEKCGMEDMKCISIDHPSHLYVTNNYVVTHNTTFIDALCYVLFGKPLRNVNKPQLINSITQKGLLVECEFTTQGNDYLVRRGMKPNVFEIYKNEDLVKQLSEMGDYQAYFEKYILKMAYKTFIQIVIQGSDDYVPFMRLPAQARRDVIEDLLETEIYSVMLELLKKMVQNLKDDAINNENALRICESKIEMNNNHLKSLKQNNEELILQKLDKVKEYKAEQESCSATLLHLNSILEPLQNSSSKLDESLKRKDKIQKSIDAAESKLGRLDKDKLFYENNELCPTCQHELEMEFKQKKVQEISAKIQTIKSALEDLVQMKSVVDKEYEQRRYDYKEAEVTKTLINSNKHQLASINKLIEEATNDIDVLKSKMPAVQNDDISSQLDEEFVELQKKKKELANKAELFGWANTILKDGGVKTKIIKQYVPIMNKIINEYLDRMDFMVSFHLDENFKEVIKSRYRDEFTYGLFSSGQKQRIDLAMLFCWRDIARMKNNAACNLLVMDEILDSHLDDEGNDQILDIIKGIAPENNIIVISHHKDKMVDKFDRTINFELKNNFSRMF